MKYKVGDKVRIKSLDWYKESKNQFGRVNCGSKSYTLEMSFFCGKILTIQAIGLDFYLMEEDNLGYEFTDEMIEGLVEEENDCEKCGLIHNSIRCLFMDNCPHNKQKNIIEIPDGYIFKDENGNVINATKIVLEKKKKEYPKTYKECCKVMNYCCNPTDVKTLHKEELIRKFQFLILYRDAYWKIAGEEMRLGKPWEPGETKLVYPITRYGTQICIHEEEFGMQRTFEFPTEEMRDAFYENFKEEIEICKELL